MDILKELGEISTPEQAMDFFKQKLEPMHYQRICQISHQEVLIKIANAIGLCEPDSVYINTGSKEDKNFIRQLALDKKEEFALAMKGHTIHFDLPQEQGRITDRTYYIADPEDDVSSLANRMDTNRAMNEIQTYMGGIMKGKTAIVGFYVRGPVGARGSNPALEITSSAYVSHSAEMLYRNSFADFSDEVARQNHFFCNIHSEGRNRPEDLPNARVFMDRKNQTTYSFHCTYAGNTLLLKKGNHRFAVDKAVYKNRGKELSEHMFITGIKGPGDRITWCAGAAPSGCGKTTTAMAGNVFVSDDLAQMWIESDGSIRSINPETGIFGIVEDVNMEGDPLLMKVMREPGHEVIWSNVLVDETQTPHWVGNNETPPEKGINFQGEWYQGKLDKNGKPIPISHPNARCTINSSSLSNFSEEAENPAGVLTRIFTYSGRDSDTMPPLWVAPGSDEGVAIGACIVSAATATEVGASGVNRSPWANAAFIPGALGDYMDAQFKFFGSSSIAPEYKPVMAGLNYFLTDRARGGDSKKLLGEKKDVKAWLAWLERYAHGEVPFLSTPIGYLPCYQDLEKLFRDIIDKPYPQELYNKQFSLYLDNIIYRIELQEKAYAREKAIPEKFFVILATQKKGLQELKQRHGSSIILPDVFEKKSSHIL